MGWRQRQKGRQWVGGRKLANGHMCVRVCVRALLVCSLPVPALPTPPSATSPAPATTHSHRAVRYLVKPAVAAVSIQHALGQLHVLLVGDRPERRHGRSAGRRVLCRWREPGRDGGGRGGGQGEGGDEESRAGETKARSRRTRARRGEESRAAGGCGEDGKELWSEPKKKEEEKIS